MAKTSTGKLGVVYIDYSVGAAANAKLIYAFREGDSEDSPWRYTLLSQTQSPTNPYLIFDDHDRPWISYFDAADNHYFLRSNTQENGSDNWTLLRHPYTSGVPLAAPTAAANQTALALTKVNGVSHVVMFVIDNNATTKGVRAARLESSTSWSPVVLIDNLGSGALGASHLSASNDASGNVAVVYQDLNLQRVKYYASSNGTTWPSTAPLSISSANQGEGANNKINPITQNLS